MSEQIYLKGPYELSPKDEYQWQVAIHRAKEGTETEREERAEYLARYIASVGELRLKEDRGRARIFA